MIYSVIVDIAASEVDEDIGIPGCITNSDYLAQMPDTVTKIGDLKPGDIIRIDQDTETMEIKAFALDIRIDALLAADLNYFFYSAENGTMITDPAKFTQNGYRYGKIVSIGQSPTTIMVNTHPDPDFKTLLYCPDRNYGIYKWHMKSKTIDNNIKRSSLKPGDIIISPSRVGSEAFAGIRTSTSTCQACRNRETSLWSTI